MTTRESLEELCHDLGSALKLDMPDGVGVALVLTYDFGEGGNLAYVSTGNREDCIRMLRELTAHLESRTN